MNTEILSVKNRQNASVTMSSVEIAQVCEKRHELVVRDIVNLNEYYEEMGYPKILDTTYIHPQNGQRYKHYLLDHDQVVDLVTGYKPNIRIKINRRWKELEEQVKKPVAIIPNFDDPIAAAEAWIDEKRKVLQLEEKERLNAPKVAFVENYVEVGTTKTFRETAKILNMPERAMISCLERDGFLYRQSGNLLPYQTAQEKGLFTVKTGTAEHGHNFTQTRVTSKGIEFIASRYASELMQ